MKISLIYILILTIFINSCDCWLKVIRFDCTSTEILMKNPKCRVKSLSRYVQVVNISFEIPETIWSLEVNYQMLIKSGINWRQILSFDNIEVCLVFKGINSTPLWNEVIKIYKSLFSTLPKICPIYPGTYLAKNVTIIENEIYDLQKLSKSLTFITNSLTSKMLPNGIYRHMITTSNELDPIGFSFIADVEINYKWNDRDF